MSNVAPERETLPAPSGRARGVGVGLRAWAMPAGSHPGRGQKERSRRGRERSVDRA